MDKYHLPGALCSIPCLLCLMYPVSASTTGTPRLNLTVDEGTDGVNTSEHTILQNKALHFASLLISKYSNTSTLNRDNLKHFLKDIGLKINTPAGLTDRQTDVFDRNSPRKRGKKSKKTVSNRKTPKRRHFRQRCLDIEDMLNRHGLADRTTLDSRDVMYLAPAIVFQLTKQCQQRRRHLQRHRNYGGKNELGIIRNHGDQNPEHDERGLNNHNDKHEVDDHKHDKHDVDGHKHAKHEADDHKHDKHDVDGHKHDSHENDDYKHDKHGVDDHKHDKHENDDHKHDKHGVDGHKHDNHENDDHKHDKHEADDHKHDKHEADDHKHDKHEIYDHKHEVDDHEHDKNEEEDYKHDKNGVDEHKHDKHGVDDHKHDKHGVDDHKHDKNGVDEHKHEHNDKKHDKYDDHEHDDIDHEHDNDKDKSGDQNHEHDDIDHEHDDIDHEHDNDKDKSGDQNHEHDDIDHEHDDINHEHDDIDHEHDNDKDKSGDQNHEHDDELNEHEVNDHEHKSNQHTHEDDDDHKSGHHNHNHDETSDRDHKLDHDHDRASHRDKEHTSDHHDEHNNPDKPCSGEHRRDQHSHRHESGDDEQKIEHYHDGHEGEGHGTNRHDHRGDSVGKHGNHEGPVHRHFSQIPLRVWGFSILAVFIISLVGLASVAIIPAMTKVFYQALIHFLVAMAVGALVGDALLHLLPHAFSGEQHNDLDNHDHHGNQGSHSSDHHGSHGNSVWKGMCSLMGIMCFFIVERVLNIVSERKVRKKAQTKTPVVSTPCPSLLDKARTVGMKLSAHHDPDYQDCEEMMFSVNADTKRDTAFCSETLLPVLIIPKNQPEHPSQQYQVTTDHAHGAHTHSHLQDNMPQSVAAIVWMVIAGDGLHNLCDGLALGAAFSNSIAGGISTTIAIFCHELPHEIGDFAVLLNAGMTVKQALTYNCVSSVLCLLGMVIGVAIGNIAEVSLWIFAGIAGMFIYIALVDMFPEMTKNPASEARNGFCRLLLHLLGISVGAGIMAVIAVYEHQLMNIVEF